MKPNGAPETETERERAFIYATIAAERALVAPDSENSLSYFIAARFWWKTAFAT